MSDAARLAKQSFAAKPPGASFSHFFLPAQSQRAIDEVLDEAIIDTAYASVISYAEALSGLNVGSSSWAIIRFYDSCFYSLKALLLLQGMIPFNSGGEMILDLSVVKFQKGGKSSHRWKWSSFRLNGSYNQWYFSQDSEHAYEKLWQDRENVNYTHIFTDPTFHQCLTSGERNLSKRFRSYRDDDEFLYTYLSDHYAIAYPTKLIVHLEQELGRSGLNLQPERIAHIKRNVWKFKERCPLT